MADFYAQVVAPRTQIVRDRPAVGNASAVPKEDPPVYLVPMDPRAYIDFFNQHLTLNGMRVQARANQALGLEGDVVRSAQLSLIAPVETLVCRIYNVDLNPAVNGGLPYLGVTALWSTAEETKDKNRTDLAWWATRNSVTRCVLVLEFKKCGALQLDDLIPCLGTQILLEKWDGEKINYEMQTTHTPKDAELFPDGKTLAKQAVRYQTSIPANAPRRVMLFDYHTLCVLQFPYNEPKGYMKALGFVWQTEVDDAWGGLWNTDVFEELQAQDFGGKLNTIGYKHSGGQNQKTVNMAKKRTEPAVPPGSPLLGGSFREMLLIYLMDGIENPEG